MAWADLDKNEQFVYEWQKGMLGSFKNGLAELICKGDIHNQRALSYGFPDEVDGIIRYQTENGWWEKVQEKAQK